MAFAPTPVLAQFAGNRMDTRVLEERTYPYGFNVQYEYSKTKDEWRYSCYDGHGGREGRKSYATLAKAKAAAKRLCVSNNWELQK